MKVLLASFSVLFLLNSCLVSKKKYRLLEQELVQLKTDLKDDDRDGVPNYLDLEPSSDSLATVDLKGRSIKIQQVVDMDGDGVLDVNDFCPTIKGIAAANGCPDQDGDGVYDFVDKCKTLAGSKEKDGCPRISPSKTNIGCQIMPRIRFKQKSLELFESKEELSRKLEIVVSLLDENPYFQVIVMANTDRTGDSLANIKLTEKRAQVIKKLLIQKGVHVSKIITEANGSNFPIAINETEEARARNNGVGFSFISREKKKVMDAGGNLKSIPFKEKSLNIALSQKELDEFLNELASYLKTHPKDQIEISGHTDAQGDSLKNQTLSKNRAKKIEKLLLEKGVNPWNIFPVGKGSVEPIANNETEKGRAVNNRVSFYIFFEEK